MFRAIKRIEEKIGSPLFARSKTGFHPFPAAEELAERGGEISEALSRAEAIRSGIGEQLGGRLRITTTDILLEYFILPRLDGFRRLFPNVDIDFGTGNEFVQMWERGFDIAVRPSASPPEHLLGQFLRRLTYTAVCAPNYRLSEDAGKGNLAGADWLVPGGDLTRHPVRKWFARNIDDGGTVTSFDSMGVMLRAARAGLGIAVVPDLDPLTKGLVRLDGVAIDEATEIWCLYHASNKGNPLVQAFNRYVRQSLA